MGASKSDSFTSEQNSLANLAKAMAHPARIAIIEYLLKSNACVCGDIVNELPLAQPTVSQHLKELKQAGIIKGSIDGNTICYCLKNEAIEPLLQFINQIITKPEHTDKNCC